MIEDQSKEASQERWNRVQRKRSLFKGLVAAFGILLALSMITTVVLQTKQLSQTSDNTKRLVDCTTPGGKCYEKGRSATSGAVGTINRATVAAVYCSGKLGPRVTITQLNDCVLALIK